MKVSKYFELEELVPKEVFEAEGEGAIKHINPIALKMLDEVREILNVPLTCNNWHRSGSRNYCGYRQPSCTVGAARSQHKLGNAFDLISSNMSANVMREKLKQNQDKLSMPIRVEKWDSSGKEITWLHIDTANTSKDKIYFFKA